MINILFVCTGNICRSSGAEAVLRHEVTKRGLSEKINIESAGTHGYHIGEAPDPRGVRAAKARGISMQGMVARQVAPEDFDLFDHIIAMDRGHHRILTSMMPNNPKATLSMFMDFCNNPQAKDVPDPYYGDDQGFEDVLDMLEEGVEGILNRLVL